jgi:hypothetical protein
MKRAKSTIIFNEPDPTAFDWNTLINVADAASPFHTHISANCPSHTDHPLVSLLNPCQRLAVTPHDQQNVSFVRVPLSDASPSETLGSVILKRPRVSSENNSVASDDDNRYIRDVETSAGKVSATNSRLGHSSDTSYLNCSYESSHRKSTGRFCE